MSKYGKKTVYLKAETECLDETDTPVRLPRYTQFTINYRICNRLLLNILQVISQKYGLNL